MNRAKMQFHGLLSVVIVLLFSVVSAFAGEGKDPFSGKYTVNTEGDQYHLTIVKTAAGNYKGFFEMDSEKIPLTGNKHGQRLVGELDEYGEIIEFIATAGKNGTLIFEDENGEIYLAHFSSGDGTIYRISEVADPPPSSGGGDNGGGGGGGGCFISSAANYGNP